MSMKDQAAAWLRSVVSRHVAANIRRFTWRTYVNEIRHNMLGGVTYLSPAEGKVVDHNDQFTLVKTGPKEFDVILTSLLTAPVNIGDKVRIEYHELRRFDGKLADGSEDVSPDGIRTVILGRVETYFPVKWEDRYLEGANERLSTDWKTIQNPYLRDLITQMEQIPIDGGKRRVVHVLIDAGAKDLRFTDPPEDSTERAGVTATVSTKRFRGQVEISYDCGIDYYCVTFTPDAVMTTDEWLRDVKQDVQEAIADQGKPYADWMRDIKFAAEGKAPLVLDNISFDELGQVLVDCIDDREWTKAKVTILKRAKAKALVAGGDETNAG